MVFKRNPQRALGHGGILLLLIISFGLAFEKSQTYSRPSAYQPIRATFDAGAVPWIHSAFVSSGITRTVHAPSVVELDGGVLRAFWFAGSREGARDVEIYSALFDPASHRWAPEQSVQTRSSVQADVNRYIRKLGNPVAVRDPSGKLWLFFVSASIGGWSTSSVNMTTSVDGGSHWSPVRRLITSPFFNLSTLVKTVPFFYSDGTLGLPIYHEFFAKYGEILHLDAEGDVIEKLRLNDKWRTLQPLVLVENARRAVALMRYSDDELPRTAIQVATADAGQHWSPAVRSMLPNPDSAMAGIGLGKGRMIVVINNNPERRDDLTLLLSEDSGQDWSEVFRFEDQSRFREKRLSFDFYVDSIRPMIASSDSGFETDENRIEAVGKVMCKQSDCTYQFDYPYLIRSANGHFHLLYTWNRTYIKHVEFNQAWLDRQFNTIKS